MARIKWLFGLIAFVFACYLALSGDVVAQGGVVFLRLEVSADSVALVQATVSEGSFKQPRIPDTTRAIQYRVMLDDGTEWTVGSRDDARIRRYEYEDPDNPGHLRSVMVTLDTAPLIIRVPYHEKLSHVEFYRKPVLESEMARGPDRRPFGRLELDLTEEAGRE